MAVVGRGTLLLVDDDDAVGDDDVLLYCGCFLVGESLPYWIEVGEWLVRGAKLQVSTNFK